MGSTAGDEFCGVVVQEIFIDAKVFFFGEDGVVGLEAVFLEEGGIALSLDVCMTKC